MSKIIIAKPNGGVPDPIGLHDSNGTIINPATVEKLDELKVLLQQIEDAVDDLELTSENIKIEAGQINLNTDELESKVQSVRDQLDVLLSTRLADSTFTGRVGEVQASPTQYTLLGRVKDLWDKLHDLFVTGVAKIRIWDGTTQANVTTDNKLQTITHGRGRCSTLNSTNVALGIGGIFTGQWEEILDYSHIIILTKADQNSSTEGLVIQWSCDGIVIDDEDKFSLLANKGKNFSFGAIGKYFRIIYTNGAIAQSSFRLQTVLKHFNMKPSSHRITEPILGDDDAELVKAVLSGAYDSTFVNVKVDSNGRLLTASNIVPPINTTSVKITQSGAVTGTADYFYVIPNGVTLTIQRLTAGSELDAVAGNVIELYDAPNGTTVGIVLIDSIYTSGNSNQSDLDDKFIGDGTRAILLRRRRFGGGAKEIFGKWEGYY